MLSITLRFLAAQKTVLTDGPAAAQYKSKASLTDNGRRCFCLPSSRAPPKNCLGDTCIRNPEEPKKDCCFSFFITHEDSRMGLWVAGLKNTLTKKQPDSGLG